MALWTPADYGTQSALDWFDANDPAITLVSGNISVWPNKGGYNGNASQATSGRRPPLTTNLLNSLPGAVFTAAQELVTATKTMGGTPLHTFSVFRYIVDGSTTYPGVAGVFGGGNGLSGDVGIQIFQVYDDGADQFALTGNGYLGGTPNVNVATSTAGVGSGSHVAAGRLSSVGNQIKVDGSVISGAFGSAAGNVPSISGKGLVIGAIDDTQTLIADNGPWSGYLHELINVWGALSDAEVETFEGYLAWKWGLQGQLPSGHPYKSAAPTTGGGSVTGTLAATEAKDVAALAGVLGYSGALAATEVSDTAAITGTVAGVSGTLAATDAKDAASLAGLLGYSGALAATEAKDTASIVGLLGYSGSLAATEAADAASISGTVSAAGATGTLAATEAKDTAAISGKLAYSGTLAATEAKDTASIIGALVIPITGTLAATEARDSASIRIIFFGGWEPTPPTGETWVPIPDNDEIWTPIASSAANWS